MNFSPTRAAAAGFRLLRDRPGAIVFWGLVYLVAFALIGGLMLAVMVPLMTSIVASPTSTDALERMTSIFIPAFAILLPLSLLFAAVMSAAAYRAVLRPTERSFGSMRLGADELRQIGVLLILFAGLMAIMGPLGMGLSFAASAAGDAAVAIWVLGAPTLACLYIFLLVRFSLAPAATFAERRIAIMSSWRLTAGRFWPMVGMYLLTWLFALGIGLVAAVINQIFLGLGPMDYLTQLVPQPGAQPGTLPDLSHLPPVSVTVIVGLIGYVVVNVITGVLRVVLYYAAPASAYAQLTGESPETTGEVFS